MRLVYCLLCLCTLLVVLPGGPCSAGDENKAEAAATVEAVAASFLKAEAAGDKARLDALAKGGNPDPWLVAEALDRLGERQTARRFALRAVRPETADLATCLEGAPDLATQKDAREALDRALAARDPRTVLAALEGWPGDARTITAVRIYYQRGKARYAIGGKELSACRVAFEEAAGLARKLKWGARASQAMAQAGRASFIIAMSTGDWAPATDCFQQGLEDEERLQSAMGQGRMHFGLFLTYKKRGDQQEAEERHLGEARRLASASNDVEYVSKILGEEAIAPKVDPEVALAKSDAAARGLLDIPTGELAMRFLPDDRRVAFARVRLLLNCAALAYRLEYGDRARTYQKQAERAAEKSSPGLRTEALAIGAVLAGAQREVEDGDADAATQFERARELFAKLAPRQPLWLAHVTGRLAKIRYRSGHYVAAGVLAEQALKILPEPKPAQDLIPALILCGQIRLRVGNEEGAREVLDEALATARTEKDAELQARALLALSSYHQLRGDFARALAALAQARKACDGCPHTEVPGLLFLKLSQLRWHMRQLAPALAAAEQAVEILEQGTQHFNLRLARTHLARLLVRDGRFEEAHALLARLREARREHSDAVGVAEALDAMADLRFLQGKAEDDPPARQGRFEEAHTLRLEALKGFDESGDRHRTIIARSQMGRDLVWAGKDAEGLMQLDQAFREAEALGSPSAQAQCSLGLAEAFHKLCKWAETIVWAERGLQLASDYGLDLAEGEGEQMRSGLLSLFHYGAEAALGEDDASVLYRFFDRGRSAVLLAALGGREALSAARVRQDLLEEEEQARSKAAKAREAAGQLGRSASFQDRNEADKAVKRAEDDVRRGVMAIRSDVRMQADLAYPDPASLEEVQRDLSPGDALILYGGVSGYLFAVVVSKTEMEVKTKSGVRLETRKEIRFVRLGKAHPVRTAVEAFLAPEEDEDELGDEKHVTPGLAGQVRQLILEPLALGKDVKRLLISPHGILSYVPFSLLDEKREICFLPSGTVLATLRDQQDSDSRGQNVLALGDPDYGTRKLLRLPATRAEVGGIADTKRGDKILLDAAASETGFRAALSSGKRWRSVHLACHGKVDREHPRRSFLALAASKEDPDGELQALEVFNMRVPSDLVVLSGCETGGGAVIEGEGLEGLTRAFMFAGAPRVIASLWNVEDDVTQALMVKFYELWNPRPKAGGPERKKRVKGTSPLGAAAALKQAQEFIRTHPDHPEWKHPTYWAAWVLWGLPD